MRPIIGLLFTPALLLALSQPIDEATKKEIAKFEGTWRFTEVEINGKTTSLGEKNQAKYILKGLTVYIVSKDGKQKEYARLKVDVTTKPKIVDVVFKEGNQVWEGIYEGKGDTARVCLNIQSEGTKERPQKFATAGRSDYVIMTFQRESK